MELKKPPRAVVAAVQGIFLAVKLFLRNKLVSYAGACSFSFLFSVIPVFMIIILILVQILHTSQDTVLSFIESIPELQQYFSTDYAMASLQSFGFFNVHQLVLVFFILWMARRSFASIFDSFQAIFHRHTKRKAILSQAVAFVVEVLTICVAAGMIFTYSSLKAVAHIPLLDKLPSLAQIPFVSRLPDILNTILSARSFNYLPTVLLFVLTAVVFRTAPGTRPPKRVCAACAALCTLSFGVLHRLMHLFLNTQRYSLIYGVLDQVIIMFMDIFFFFVIFLFFAQLVFVIQFFDRLMIEELYLLPRDEQGGVLPALKKRLFEAPETFTAKKMETLDVPAGAAIFAPGDDGQCAYYVLGGAVTLQAPGDEAAVYAAGDFFGETDCVLKSPRTATATATEDSTLVKIDGETFSRLVEQNSKAAVKVLMHINPFQR